MGRVESSSNINEGTNMIAVNIVFPFLENMDFWLLPAQDTMILILNWTVNKKPDSSSREKWFEMEMEASLKFQ